MDPLEDIDVELIKFWMVHRRSMYKDEISNTSEMYVTVWATDVNDARRRFKILFPEDAKIIENKTILTTSQLS